MAVSVTCESDIQALILIYVTSLPGSFGFRMNTGAVQDSGRFIRYGVPGQPDIFLILKGRFIGIEVKTRTGRQSEAQKQWQRNCERAGGLYILARSVHDVEVRLREEGLV